jgi:acyl carrier protein
METAVTADQVERTIVDAIASLGHDRGEITRDATFEALDIDSLDVVEIAQVVEEEFGVEVKGEDAKNLRSVGDAIDLVVARAS